MTETRIAYQVAPPAQDITPDALMRLIPDAEQNELMAIGQTRDEQHWSIGNRMAEKIDVLGWPTRQTSVVYARLTKYANERNVREFYYCSSFYQKNQDLFVEFFAVCDWQVFNLARKCDDPRAVLLAASTEGYSPAELRELFKADHDDPESEKSEPKYPIYVRPVMRWLRNRIKPEKWAEIETLMDMFLAKARELSEG